MDVREIVSPSQAGAERASGQTGVLWRGLKSSGKEVMTKSGGMLGLTLRKPDSGDGKHKAPHCASKGGTTSPRQCCAGARGHVWCLQSGS